MYLFIILGSTQIQEDTTNKTDAILVRLYHFLLINAAFMIYLYMRFKKTFYGAFMTQVDSLNVSGFQLMNTQLSFFHTFMFTY